jgi:hypothetical protein
MELLAAIQIGLTNPNFPLPLTNQVNEELKVEPYLKKELVVETVVTPPDPPQKVSYKPTGDVETIGFSNESCVVYAKRVTGKYWPMGNGARGGINSSIPKVGAIGSEKSIVHAFVVERIEENGVFATEANYRTGFITRRFIPFSDILGYVI